MFVVRLLGEVAASVDERPIDLGPPRQRCVLAALAVEADRVVAVDRLVERVWGEDVPQRGRETLHSYVSRLRLALAGADGVAVVRRSGGYALVADEPVVDLSRFRSLRDRARADTDVTRAAGSLTEALGLWRGEALTGLGGRWVEAERDRLERERLAAQHDLVDARLRSGRGEDLVVELAARAAAHPLDERVAGQYVLALHQAGRTADALEHYRLIRTRLVDELGVDPGATLQDLHRQVLAADPLLAGTRPSAAAPRTVPLQLPARPAAFVGRTAELDRLDAALEGSGGPVVVSAIAGSGGIGKTWLALHWAHRHADRFPDGHLFVDLRGFSPDGEPMAPAVAVRGFLDALGVEPTRVPVDEHARTALFRSLVADRRMLLVLDNAIDTSQVTPLLPGSASCAVVVTSRNRLTGLITGHGGLHVPLDVLSDAEARTLLADRLGAARVAAEPAAVDRLVALCGRYPLALGIVAAQAQTRPHLSLAALADELRDLGVDALDDEDPGASLPTVLSWSRHALTADQATAFALLAIAPGPDIGVQAATALTGLPPAATRSVLRGLEQASLLIPAADGRYRMHDLIRRYAADTAEHLPSPEREAALRRIVDFYLHSAHAADRRLSPHRPPIALDPPVPGARALRFADVPAALAWFDVEHRCLPAVQDTASAHGWHRAVCDLAWTVQTVHHWKARLSDKAAAWRAGLSAAERLDDPTTEAMALRLLGRACAELGRHDEAEEHLLRALDLAERHDDQVNLARVHGTLAWSRGERGDQVRALEHALLSLEVYRALDNPVWHARALSAVGWFAARLGDLDLAREHCRAALALHLDHPDPEGEAATRDSLGYLDHQTGRHADAVSHYRQALALFRGIGDVYEQANTLDRLGHPLAALGRHEEARALWGEALEFYRAQGRDDDVRRVRLHLDLVQWH